MKELSTNFLVFPLSNKSCRVDVNHQSGDTRLRMYLHRVNAIDSTLIACV